MTLLLDTCAIVFIVAEPEKLSETARREATRAENVVAVSCVSAAELACATDRGRVKLDKPWDEWFRTQVQKYGWTVLPITPQEMMEAYALPGAFHNDPADRVIVAQARLGQYTVVTTDSRIRDYPHVQSID